MLERDFRGSFIALPTMQMCRGVLPMGRSRASTGLEHELCRSRTQADDLPSELCHAQDSSETSSAGGGFAGGQPQMCRTFGTTKEDQNGPVAKGGTGGTDRDRVHEPVERDRDAHTGSAAERGSRARRQPKVWHPL